MLQYLERATIWTTDAMFQPLTPLQIATMVRQLDSRLVNIVGEMRENELSLVYSFLVAGTMHVFTVENISRTVASIADLYPSAAQYEEKLSQQWSLVFQRPE